MAGESGDDLILEGAEKEEVSTCSGSHHHKSGLMTGASIGFAVGVVFAFGGFKAGFVALVCTILGGLIGYVLKPS